MQMIPVRVFFSKTGRAKYTSHLDTMRTMTRAFRRSGLPLWYTEGFNPHLYMTFALPIALGYEGLRESVDIRLTQEIFLGDVARRLDASLPPGFAALEAAVPVMDASSIAWADYDIRLFGGEETVAPLEEVLSVLMAQPVIEVEKKTKKGIQTVDIRPHAALLGTAREAGALSLRLRLSSGNKMNVNPTLLLEALYARSPARPDRVNITRSYIYNEKLEQFV